MKKNLAEWKIRNTYTLAEATLLMLGHDPGEWPQSKLIEKAPPKFDLLFGKMIEDAKLHLGYRESEEVEGKHFAEYQLMTDNPENINTRTRNEFYTTTSDRPSFNRWAKSLVSYLKSTGQKIDGIDFDFFNSDLTIGPATGIEMETERLSPRKENNLLRLIDGLARGLKGYDLKNPYTSAKAVIEASASTLTESTVAQYLMKAHEILEEDRKKS